MESKQEPTLVITPEALVLRMTNAELIAAFDPKERDSLVAERLKTKSEGKPFVVWDEDKGTHLVDPSVTCLEELIAGYPPRNSMVINGKVCPVLPLTTRPCVWVDENPVKKGEALHRDGTSQVGVPWGKLSFYIRQLIRVGWAHLEDPKEVSGSEQSIYLIFRQLDDNEAAQLYQRSALKLRELLASGNGPNLRVKL
jgi:hypothetical protein